MKAGNERTEGRPCILYYCFTSRVVLGMKIFGLIEENMFEIYLSLNYGRITNTYIMASAIPDIMYTPTIQLI